MSKSQYTLFHDKCNDLEGRFGNQGRLRLEDACDLNVVRCKKLLDFGAGKGLNAGLCEEYFRFDTDADLEPNFTSFGDMTPDHMFDGVIANQVFEHISREDLFETAEQLVEHMAPGAKIIVTIPNVQRGSYYFNDFDHKTPLMFYQVGALFEINGLTVTDCYRYTKRPDEIKNADDNIKALFEIMRKYYELDPAQFLAVVAEK